MEQHIKQKSRLLNTNTEKTSERKTYLGRRSESKQNLFDFTKGHHLCVILVQVFWWRITTSFNQLSTYPSRKSPTRNQSSSTCWGSMFYKLATNQVFWRKDNWKASSHATGFIFREPSLHRSLWWVLTNLSILVSKLGILQPPQRIHTKQTQDTQAQFAASTQPCKRSSQLERPPESIQNQTTEKINKETKGRFFFCQWKQGMNTETCWNLIVSNMPWYPKHRVFPNKKDQFNQSNIHSKKKTIYIAWK